MNIITPSHRICRATEDGITAIEEAARTCYLSEPKDTPELRKGFKNFVGYIIHDPDIKEKRFKDYVRNKFIDKLRKMGHQTPFEFMDIEIEFVCDRGVSHELVRHRMCSPMQESTRYCDYSTKGKHGVNVIKPFFFDEEEEQKNVNVPLFSRRSYNTVREKNNLSLFNKFDVWAISMANAEWAYEQLLDLGATAQEARSVLPNSLKTKLKIKANVREWWHLFKLRAVNTGAHPQIRELMIPALKECAERWPVLFEWLLVGLDDDLNKPARPKTGE